MTITVPFLDTVIRHRFVGHANLGDNHMGIMTFTAPEFQQVGPETLTLKYSSARG